MKYLFSNNRSEEIKIHPGIIVSGVVSLALACNAFPLSFIIFLPDFLYSACNLSESKAYVLAFIGVTIETGGADLLLAGGAFIVLSGIVVNCFGAIPFYALQAVADSFWDWIAKGWSGDANNHPPVPEKAINDMKNGIKVNPMQLCQGIGGTWLATENKCNIPPQVLKKASNDGNGSDPALVAVQSCDNAALQNVYPFATASYDGNSGACTMQMNFANIDVPQVIAAFGGDNQGSIASVPSSDTASVEPSDTASVAPDDGGYYSYKDTSAT